MAKTLRLVGIVVLIIALVFVIAGCGKKGESKSAASGGGMMPPGMPGGSGGGMGMMPPGMSPGGGMGMMPPMMGGGGGGMMPMMGGMPGGAAGSASGGTAAAAPAAGAIHYPKVSFDKAPKSSPVKHIVKHSDLGKNVTLVQFSWKDPSTGITWYVEMPEKLTKQDRTVAGWCQLYRALGESSELRKLKKEAQTF